MSVQESLIQALAPTGKLRAVINLGNPILASRDAQTGAPAGVSVDISTELARRLGVEPEFVVVEKAADSVAAVNQGRVDVGFFAIDPARGAEIAFTAPYLLIEGSYLVQADSPLSVNEEVDRPGTRVVVGKGSAYDLFLTRELKHAEIVRAPCSPDVVPAFLAQGLDVAAGVRQQLEMDAARLSGLRLLPGRFMVIQQAMGVAKPRGSEAAFWLSVFVEEMKASGFVAQALQRHGVEGVSVAPVA
jgi:polar amino acid transport system substrate-binding protein